MKNCERKQSVLIDRSFSSRPSFRPLSPPEDLLPPPAEQRHPSTMFQRHQQTRLKDLQETRGDSILIHHEPIALPQNVGDAESEVTGAANISIDLDYSA
ncbi:hypothetical protein JTB14_018420 [Gonioctena quinquepunctata]|nr:hypothetical protein JTB14_018420 [Gonioctena quinquepunctata]